MPKRKHDESEDTLETGNVDQGDFSDGDESEDDEEDGNGKTDKYDMMREDDIEGQEDPTQEFDGEIQITPFNMKEEMEEGDIDKEGMYIFKKREKDEVKDHWLDNIDWVKVNSQATSSSKNLSEEESSMDATDYLKKFDPIPAYKEMLTILLPGETVLKALKRLGGGKVQTASERWKKKKQQNDGTSQTNELNKEHIAKLTEHANNILSQGNMDVYQETFEGIRYKVQKAEEPVSQKSSNELDMFGDMFEEKTKAANKRESESVEGEPITKKVRFNEDEGQAMEEEEKPSDAVQWEFKWENNEKAEVHGPHSSSEMLDWVNQGYFESGVWVRRVGQQGDFYTSRRIDFDLYL